MLKNAPVEGRSKLPHFLSRSFTYLPQHVCCYKNTISHFEKLVSRDSKDTVLFHFISAGTAINLLLYIGKILEKVNGNKYKLLTEVTNLKKTRFSALIL